MSLDKRSELHPQNVILPEEDGEVFVHGINPPLIDKEEHKVPDKDLMETTYSFIINLTDNNKT